MKILIIRRDNIGDLICTTPLFEVLRHRYPNAYLAALVNSYNAPAIQGNPYLDAVFAYTKGKHAAGESVAQAYLKRLKLLWSLRRQRFDYVLLPGSGFARRALGLARLLAPRHIVGFVTEQATSSAIDFAIPYGDGGTLHETEDMFRLLSPLDVGEQIPRMTVVPDPALVAALRCRLPDSVRTGSGPLVALHISARKEKQRWPVDRFAELARNLRAKYDARFLLFWSPGDENNPFHPGDDGKAARLLDAMVDLPVAPVSTSHLSELMAGLSMCDVAVLSDGGAMHVAAGLGKPVLCFFGNSPASRWYPWGVRHELLQTPSRDVNDILTDDACQAFARLIANPFKA